MKTIPIGAGVKYQGRLGMRIRIPLRYRQRGYVAVSFVPGSGDVVMLPSREVSYIARHYETALLWEQRKP